MKCRWLVTVFSLIIIGGCKGEPGPAEVVPEPASPRLAELLRPVPGSAFPAVTEPRPFTFPADHGPHPEYRNEWWYFTGNLDGASGRRFGFELTLFRFALTPAEPVSADASRWRTNQVYIGHFAITDAANEAFYVTERYARGALGLAGAAAEPFRVWLGDWFVKALPRLKGLPAAEPGPAAEDVPEREHWLLHATDEGMGLTLSLDASKPPVKNGIDGLSRKSDEAGNASYYYSIPRLAATGTVTLDGHTEDVTGLAWLDREWGSSALADDQQGWDWFALQLSDGSDLMFYNLRRDDGSRDPASAGTYIDAQGNGSYLGAAEVTIRERDHWTNARGDRYPVAWSLAVPSLELSLEIDPLIEAQELVTRVRYWEGAVDVRGTRAGRDVSGRGYVELTGYAR